MSSSHPAAARPRAVLALGTAIGFALAACAPATPTPSTTPASAQTSPTLAATASPSPTPAPTPVYTNPADPELAALIPDEVGAQAVTKPAAGAFGVTPGDVGEVYGEIGLRFVALQLAYVERPRLSLYAMRMRAPFATTAELEPFLATAGQYVGIAGLHRDPWQLVEVENRLAWVRPEDDATIAGTMVYTWAADGYVFLLIGVDDVLNRALLAALPGEPAPTPSPRPSRSPAESGSAAPSASAGQS
ncbi:MAG TPA: hypothetical protein VEW45_05490 [Candidatus Dormibacteraeota bacterium]|nr:hypothetical protein [Candidatus Dormibacteraeota bacterium]